MRIAMDARMARVTGIGRYIECLSRELRESGDVITMLTSPSDRTWWRANYPTALCLEIPDAYYSWSEQLLMPSRLQRASFDLVHFTNFNVPLSIRVPYVVTVHDLTPLNFGGERRRSWLSQRAYQQVLAKGLNRAQHIIVPSQMIKRQLLAWATPEKISVIPHGIGHEFTTPRSTLATQQHVLKKFGISGPFVLYVGNMRSHKNIPTLLTAFAGLHAAFKTSRLVLVGPSTAGQVKAVKSLIHTLAIADQVVLTGSLNNTELLALYDAAQIFVLPSFAEGFGLVALEAAARGVPVVVSETTPVREFLGRAVLSFNPRKADALADLLVMLWSNPTLRERRSSMAQSLALARTWRNVANDTTAVYQRALVSKVSTE